MDNAVVWDYIEESHGGLSVLFLKPGMRPKFPMSWTGKLIEGLNENNIAEHMDPHGPCAGYIDINANYNQMARRGAEISWIEILDPEFRGRGFGRDLTQVGAMHIGGYGVGRLELEAHNGTEGFHEKMGFTRETSQKGLRSNIISMATNLPNTELNAAWTKFKMNPTLSQIASDLTARREIS
ncbi:MAG: GNAT family N-acetyltransferase [Firmicutes bacterium]|nr:GNAT family N-acetyltransferase [Bacillota bacterium]